MIMISFGLIMITAVIYRFLREQACKNKIELNWYNYLQVDYTCYLEWYWQGPNISSDVVEQRVGVHSPADHTTVRFVELIPPHFATTCHGSILPFFVSQSCLFALQTRFWLVEAQPWIANQTPWIIRKNFRKQVWILLIF